MKKERSLMNKHTDVRTDGREDGRTGGRTDGREGSNSNVDLS